MCDEGSSDRLARGMTVLETVIALSILSVVFVTTLPLLASIRNSWDARQANAEVIQNGRVMVDHIHRNLVKAVRIEEVSPCSDTDGYIEFEATDGDDYRYEIGRDGYVRFGPVRDLADLAGPVSRLQFTCYDGLDLDTPTTQAAAVRFVRVEGTFTTAAELGQDRTFTTSAYLRTRSDRNRIWRNQDIGRVRESGSASQWGNNWAIEGSGDDVWSDEDEFHYVYRPLTGDGQIIAQIEDIDYTDGWAKSGAMIRESLDDDSRHAFMFMTPGRGYSFRWRTSTGGMTLHTQGSTYGVRPPYWVKLTRAGDTFTGYASPNGLHWHLVERVTIHMDEDIYIGLAITARDDGDLCSSHVDNVYVTDRTTAGAALVPQTLTPPQIDGDVDDVWSGAPAYPLNHLIWGSLYWMFPEADLSGTWSALWDRSNIYYLLDMNDNYRKNNSGSSWRDDDTAEVFIDADNSRTVTYDGVNDFHYGFRCFDNDVHIGPQSVNDDTGVHFQMHNTYDGYRLEIAIPWSTLNATSSDGLMMGAEIFVDDDDDYGSRDATMAWYGTSDSYWQFPSQWGTAELTEHDFGTDGVQLLP
jgi:hypothetical protein